MKYIAILIIAYLSVILLTPYLIKLSHKIDFLDKPTDRKQHKNATSLMGGIGIFLGFFITYAIFKNDIESQDIILFIASTLILGIGLVDDYYKTQGMEFRILPRVIIQLIAIILVFLAGISFKGITNPLTNEYIDFPYYLQFIFTVIWVFGTTTIINWCDGLDGLSGGLSLISGMTFIVIGLLKGQTDSAIISCSLTGAILGFLKFNWAPAKIFIGDSGANFCGFMLGIIALDGAFKNVTFISFFIPILVLAVPIYDNIFAIIKRLLDKKPIYKADRNQLHYKILDSGVNAEFTVKYILLMSVCFNLISIVIVLLDT